MFSNCGTGNVNGKCDHTLSYANGKLSLEISGCTETIPLAIAGLTSAELATALTALLAANNPAVQTALTQMITNVVKTLVSPTNQQFIDAVNGGIASGAILIPKPSCADIQAVFGSVGADPTGQYLLGADCKKYSVAAIAALAAIDPAKLVDLITNNTLVKGAINTAVNQGITSGAIVIPPAVTCPSLSALFSTGAAPVATTKLFGEGCKTYTISQIAAAVAAAGGDVQTLSIVGPDLAILNGNTVKLSDIVAGGLAAPLAPNVVTNLGNAITTIVNTPGSTLATAIDTKITDKVTCAFVGNLFPAGTDTLTGAELFMTAGCHSHTLTAISNFVAANASVKAENIAPGNLPATVKVSCASLTATPGVPAAGDEILTIGCKTLKILQSRSSTGILLPRWELAAA
jgi:hypothetical protein